RLPSSLHHSHLFRGVKRFATNLKSVYVTVRTAVSERNLNLLVRADKRKFVLVVIVELDLQPLTFRVVNLYRLLPLFLFHFVSSGNSLLCKCCGNFAMSFSTLPFSSICFTNTGTPADVH